MNAQHFRRRADWYSLLVVTAHIALAISPVYVSAVLGAGWWTPGLWLIFGLSMNGLLNLMHECAHLLVFTKRQWSELLGRRILAPLVFADFDSYRDRHWAHHKCLGREGETKDTYLINITGPRLAVLVVRCGLMVEAAKRFSKQIPHAGRAKTSRAWLFTVVTFQTLFFGTLLITAQLSSDQWKTAVVRASVTYAVVYVYALMSVTVFMATLRAIAEHQVTDDRSASSGHAALRNFSCNGFSRYLMGAYGFAEHFTHHRVPGIPYYHLRHATEELAADDAMLRPQAGYFAVLAKIAGRGLLKADVADGR